MNKSLILITILIILYLYWKTQQNKTLPPKTDDIIEIKGKDKELFYEAEDFDLDSDHEHQTSGSGSVELPAAKLVLVNDEVEQTKVYPIEEDDGREDKND